MFSIVRRKAIINPLPSKKFALLEKVSQSEMKIRQMSTTADARFLLSTENLNRCLDCIKKAPPMGVKMRKSAKESNFASVLIAICLDSQGEASVLYTRRSAQIRSHVRQIAFPGGLKDPEDADFIACALRETEEEIGLPRERVKIWGTGALIKPPLTAAIMPVLGIIENFNLQELRLNTAEVEEAFTIPISKLSDPSSLRYTQFKTGYSAPVFIVGNYKIWGITGFLTNTFLNCFIPNSRLKNQIKFIRPYQHPKREENIKNSVEYSMNW